MSKSQSILIVISYLSKSQATQLQILSKRFYEVLIPTTLHFFPVSFKPQFMVIDFKTRELYSFLVAQSLNPRREWKKRELLKVGDEAEMNLSGGFKLISISEYG